MAISKTSPFRFLNSTAARALTGVLLLQGVVLYAVSRPEIIPFAPPLSSFPLTIGGDWQMKQESYVDDETRAVLRADDLLSRTYMHADEQIPVNLFIAAFRSQRTGKAPHSPKNCLPGAGWMQDTAGTVSIDIPGAGPIEVNRYIVAKGASRALVLYWYQSSMRTIASEYTAKVYVVADSIRYNRTDAALVRVWAPVVGNDDAGAFKAASSFVQTVYPVVREYLPK